MGHGWHPTGTPQGRPSSTCRFPSPSTGFCWENHRCEGCGHCRGLGTPVLCPHSHIPIRENQMVTKVLFFKHSFTFQWERCQVQLLGLPLSQQPLLGQLISWISWERLNSEQQLSSQTAPVPSHQKPCFSLTASSPPKFPGFSLQLEEIWQIPWLHVTSSTRRDNSQEQQGQDGVQTKAGQSLEQQLSPDPRAQRVSPTPTQDYSPKTAGSRQDFSSFSGEKLWFCKVGGCKMLLPPQGHPGPVIVLPPGCECWGRGWAASWGCRILGGCDNLGGCSILRDCSILGAGASQGAVAFWALQNFGELSGTRVLQNFGGLWYLGSLQDHGGAAAFFGECSILGGCSMLGDCRILGGCSILEGSAAPGTQFLWGSAFWESQHLKGLQPFEGLSILGCSAFCEAAAFWGTQNFWELQHFLGMEHFGELSLLGVCSISGASAALLLPLLFPLTKYLLKEGIPAARPWARLPPAFPKPGKPLERESHGPPEPRAQAWHGGDSPSHWAQGWLHPALCWTESTRSHLPVSPVSPGATTSRPPPGHRRAWPRKRRPL